jgi:hypothetical protein
MDKKKVLLIICIITVFLCGCPGIGLIIDGLLRLGNAFVGRIQDPGLWGQALAEGMGNLGFLACIGGMAVLVPVILLIVWLVVRKQKPKPSGVSGADQLPPPS